MSKNRLLAVTLTALVLPGLVAGGAFASCLRVGAGPHQCPAMASRCDRTADGHARTTGGETTVSDGHECACAHSPSPEADPAASSQAPRPVDGPGAASAVAVPPTPSAAVRRTVRSRSHAPPPADPPRFLLDCALLI